MTGPEGTSALHAIRDTELAMARRLDEAREAAARRVREARTKVRDDVAAAEIRGRAAADRMLTETLTQAEAMAADIRDAGAVRANALRAQVADRLDAVVDELVELVLAPPLEESR